MTENVLFSLEIWPFLAIFLAAAIIGFTSGMSPAPAAGQITSAITGVAVGLIAAMTSDCIGKLDNNLVSLYVFIYLLVLFGFHMLGNRLRVKKIYFGIWS